MPHEVLSLAQISALESVKNVARDVDNLSYELNTLRRMHSQLARLNMERQRTIEVLTAMAKNLFAYAEPIQPDRDSSWSRLAEEYREAIKLAERTPAEMGGEP
jgi:hypothetical protein